MVKSHVDYPKGEVLLGSAQVLAPVDWYGIAQPLQTIPQGERGCVFVLIPPRHLPCGASETVSSGQQQRHWNSMPQRNCKVWKKMTPCPPWPKPLPVTADTASAVPTLEGKRLHQG